MGTRVIVRVTGRIGIEEADRLLANLAKETGLYWREENSPDSRQLSGLDLLLTAVVGGAVGKGTELAVGTAVDQVREVIGRLRARRLDPPDVEVETEELPVAEPGDATGDEAGPGITEG
jgi:hypothetical protein